MKPILFILLLLLSSCGNSNDIKFLPPVVKYDSEVKEKVVEVKMMSTPVMNDAVGDKRNEKAEQVRSKAVSDTSKKIIKQGDIKFETASLANTRQGILNSLKKAGGYIAEENQTNNSDENRKEYVLKTRIPAKNFDAFLNDVADAAAQIDAKNISITDVTAQYIDITTRLNNKKQLENRYLELLKKAGKMADLLEIEAKLTEIRSDIESTQGQLNYLSKQVAYSSLDITFYTKQSLQEDKGYGFGYKLKHAMGDGWVWLQGLFFGLIAAWPVLLIICVCTWLFKRWRRRKKASKAI